MLFSKDFIPIKYESLFQKKNISSKKGEAIINPNTIESLEYFNFFKKARLNNTNEIMNQVHGFLKIIMKAMIIKKKLIVLVYVFSEIFIIKNKIN